MKIKNLEISGYAALAPMAGVADRAFRELCKSYGAAYVITEMVSSKGLTMQDKKSKELLFISEAEHPAGAQIFGDTPETMALAAKKALEFSPDFIDINMGCPAPKIAGNGGGSALMKKPQLAGEIVKAVRRVVELPLSVKMRIGWDENSINCVELAKICEANGADAITVHGRTKVQMYSPPVDLKPIAAVKKAVSIPVIGNGDIVDGKSAEIMLNETGCDFLMVGRGALGAPWVFSQINAYLEKGEILPEPDIDEKMNIMLSHIKTLCDYKGEYVGMREARKHAAWYIKGMRGAAEFRREIGTLEHIEQLEVLAQKVKNCCKSL
ncbi:MAG: tRNA dihydrouridine synthase DusB [Clostridia bacterium]|nr:tRNA dihydrouridine synthase DusB [Clostridia bacterium]